MKMDCKKTIREFYRRLNHQEYGLTELVALDRDTGKIVATGFFDFEEYFVAACLEYNKLYNVYAGRNPRPKALSGVKNVMSSRRRAKDKDIRFLTAISLDIDPIRKRGMPATKQQHEAATSFALGVQWDLCGDVDDSGNGAYLWLPFLTPIAVNPSNLDGVKQQCKEWQASIARKYRPEMYGLRIDACYDFARIKRVIGTFNHKALRQSQFVRKGEISDKVRSAILAMKVPEKRKFEKITIPPLIPVDMPLEFRELLKRDAVVRDLWERPDSEDDRSRHDWMLGAACFESGLTDANQLASILMTNPYGKFRRDGRRDYVRRTVEKLFLSR